MSQGFFLEVPLEFYADILTGIIIPPEVSKRNLPKISFVILSYIPQEIPPGILFLGIFPGIPFKNA